MASKKTYESATIAANWWLDVAQNGITPNLPNELQYAYNFAKLIKQKSPYSKQTFAKLHREIIKKVSKNLNEFGLVHLYTNTEPEGLLKECANEAIILYKFDNPFPSNVNMQITKESVIVKGKNLHKILFNEQNIER